MNYYKRLLVNAFFAKESTNEERERLIYKVKESCYKMLNATQFVQKKYHFYGRVLIRLAIDALVRVENESRFRENMNLLHNEDYPNMIQIGIDTLEYRLSDLDINPNYNFGYAEYDGNLRMLDDREKNFVYRNEYYRKDPATNEFVLVATRRANSHKLDVLRRDLWHDYNTHEEDYKFCSRFSMIYGENRIINETARTITYTYKYYYRGDLLEIRTPYETAYFFGLEQVKQAGFKQCEGCDNFVSRVSRIVYTKDNVEHIFCSHRCATRAGWRVCHSCGTTANIYEPNVNYVQTGSNRFVCQSCYERYYGQCASCGDVYRIDDMRELDNGVHVCGECYEINYKFIFSYHHAKDGNLWEFYKLDSEPRTVDYIGTETEVEVSGDRERTAKAVNELYNKDKKLAHFENDGSLSHGFEIITNPMSLGWIYENESVFRKVFAKLISLGAKSHDTKTCGLHIHYSRSSFDNDSTSRLIYLFEKFQQELVTLSRRTPASIARWASFCNFGELSLDYIKHNMGNMSRYKAVNLNNSKTIEIRIFKGTLKFETYMASIELVNNLMTIAREKDNASIMDVTFKDVLEYKETKYLLDYARSKDLYGGGE